MMDELLLRMIKDYGILCFEAAGTSGEQGIEAEKRRDQQLLYIQTAVKAAFQPNPYVPFTRKTLPVDAWVRMQGWDNNLSVRIVSRNDGHVWLATQPMTVVSYAELLRQYEISTDQEATWGPAGLLGVVNAVELQRENDDLRQQVKSWKDYAARLRCPTCPLRH